MRIPVKLRRRYDSRLFNLRSHGTVISGGLQILWNVAGGSGADGKQLARVIQKVCFSFLIHLNVLLTYRKWYDSGLWVCWRRTAVPDNRTRLSHQFHSLGLTSDSDVHQYNNYRGLMSTFLLSIASCAINKFSVTAQSIAVWATERSWITARVFCRAFRVLIMAFSASLLITLIKDGGKWMPPLSSVIEHSVLIQLLQTHWCSKTLWKDRTAKTVAQLYFCFPFTNNANNPCEIIKWDCIVFALWSVSRSRNRGTLPYWCPNGREAVSPRSQRSVSTQGWN